LKSDWNVGYFFLSQYSTSSWQKMKIGITFDPFNKTQNRVKNILWKGPNIIDPYRLRNSIGEYRG
ncbi:MAG: hypothetical protein AAF765_16845, partial [Bacteroidota bacterium]